MCEQGGQRFDSDGGDVGSFVTALSHSNLDENDAMPSDGNGTPPPACAERRNSVLELLQKLVTRPRSFFKRSSTDESSETHQPPSKFTNLAIWRFGGGGQVIDVNDLSPLGDEWPTSRMTFSLDDDVLGVGKSGTVIRAKHRESGCAVAIKFLDRSHMDIRPQALDDDWTQLQREISVQSRLSAHPNVISVKGAFHDSEFAYIFMELAKGDLFSAINKSEERGMRGMGKKRVKRIAFDIACALRSCHESGFIHRDVKPENVMLVGNGDDEVAKLGDFGVCVPMDDDGYYTGPGGGTIGYLGPEGMIRKPRVGPKIDWFAFGVMLFIMLCGELPYPMCRDPSIFQEPIKFPSPLQRRKRVGRQAKHLVRGLLEADVSKRFGAEQVFSHPWFRKIAGRGNLERGWVSLL